MTDYSDIDDLISGQEDSGSKYFRVNVSNYNGAATPADQESGYLRVGAVVDGSWKDEPGADLAILAYQVGPAGKEADATIKGQLAAVSPDGYDAEADYYPPYIDDQRERGSSNVNPTGPEGHGYDLDERRAISDELLSKGGWRDHCDGNRITTTRGDKIEVVYGNYKLIVMGRQPDTGQGMGWEASGNNVQDFAGATMPGASVTVDWMSHRYGGAWLLQNSTERVFQYSRNAGNFRTQNWGELLETYIGSENPPSYSVEHSACVGVNDDDGMQGHPTTIDGALGGTMAAPWTSSVGLPRGNPHIIEKTWATKIETYVGTAIKPVPHIIEKKWANRIESYTGSSGDPVAHIKEEKFAKEIQTYTYAASVVNISAAANTLEVALGIKESIAVGAELSIFLGGKLDISVSGTVEIHNFKNVATVEKNEAIASENRLKGIENNIAATVTHLEGAVNQLSQTQLRVGLKRTVLASETTSLGLVISELAADINMGL
jgi:hypothetical protein